MDDANVSKVSYRLDWQRVEELVKEHFNLEEQLILNSVFGLNEQPKLTMKQLGKQLKVKPKLLSERIQKLEKQLYKILKTENLDELIQEHLEALSLTEEITQLSEEN